MSSEDRNEHVQLGFEETFALQGEYHVHRTLALFANLRNVTNATEDFEVAGPSTPPHAQFRSRQDFGSLWTVGLKGSF